ncbi:hypothetical protein G9U51_05340 [Calidifontibacter sp. DB0510]|uniref:Uncharacterized protein n=1 Tax=Metallococcus carri TaxID=1656884 RepID=A0A967B400_9MICO|nr:hypothetical protein [Metallococcus carri]NHN55212.1 hypothetical protein [Metallococcus carri]NOP36289.1 hypothetical protein [Calidifontibacter sp. DB2511S]
MHPLVNYAVVCALPAVLFGVIEKGARVWMGTSPMPGRARPVATPVADTEGRRSRRPIEQLAEDLRRIGDELTRLRSADGYARRHRREATALAYDDVLRECARALEVPVPPCPFDDVMRLQVEADLARAGLLW